MRYWPKIWKLTIKSFNRDHNIRTHSSDGVNLHLIDFDELLIKASTINSNDPFLYIPVKNSMPGSITIPMLKRANGKFTQEERDYIGAQIIKDIRLPYKFQ